MVYGVNSVFFDGPMEYCHGQEKTKKSCFATTTTPCQISYIGICRISTGAGRSCHTSHAMMSPSARLFLGKGARCSCLVKFIRLSKDVATALVNLEQGRRVDDLIAISRARMCIPFCIPVPAGRHFSESTEFCSISRFRRNTRRN